MIGISAGAGSGISTRAYAPAMISSPWAKLISLMTPKMSAMPSANSAYRLPSEIASIASWITRSVVTSPSGAIARSQKPR